MIKRVVLLAGAAAAALAAPGLAQSIATVTTDLNLRSGPGTTHGIVGVAPARSSIEVIRCDAGGGWCEVAFEGTRAYASAAYLEMGAPGAVTVATPAILVPATPETVVVVPPKSAWTTDGTTTAWSGVTVAPQAAEPSVIAINPNAQVIALSPAAQVVATAPEAELVAFVRQNPVAPVVIEREIVPGIVIPEDVVLYPMHDSGVSYANVNGGFVFVEPQARQVIRIVR